MDLIKKHYMCDMNKVREVFSSKLLDHGTWSTSSTSQFEFSNANAMSGKYFELPKFVDV